MKCVYCECEGATLLLPGIGWIHPKCIPENPYIEKLDRIIELLERLIE